MKEEEPPSKALDKTPVRGVTEGNVKMQEIWNRAAKEFEDICKESLTKGPVRNFDDVQTVIERIGKSKATYESEADPDAEEKRKWEKAKSVGLQSLRYLKMLVGAASQASSFFPIPSSAASIMTSALCFVFDIPGKVKGYNDAVSQVFSEVTGILSQFRIYSNMNSIDHTLEEQINMVMVSFVRLCGHVVKYRQEKRWHRRALQQAKAAILDDDSGLSAELNTFRDAMAQKREVEGTMTLSLITQTHSDVELVLQKMADSIAITEDVRQTTQETQKDVRSMADDVDRNKQLIKIRDALDVPATVRFEAHTTYTCTKIYNQCLDGTGEWIWTNRDYLDWMGPSLADAKTQTQNRDATAQSGLTLTAPPHILFLTGPPSSGKTSAVSLITKKLEELQQQKSRTFVAHYFFAAVSQKTGADTVDKHPVQTALKYIAFQLARVDPVMRKLLVKSCEAGPATFREISRMSSLDGLSKLWDELKFGASVAASGVMYTLVFDGLENLPEQQAQLLLEFLAANWRAGEPTSKTSASGHRQIRMLLSGTDDLFRKNVFYSTNTTVVRQICIEECNGADMRACIEDALLKQGILQNARPNSVQWQARQTIRDRLPEKSDGSYARLEFELEEVLRLISTRKDLKELDQLLNKDRSSHASAIQALQRSLTANEIDELNELLKWIMYGNEYLTLNELEGVLYLYTDIESLVSLQYIIRSKFSAILKTSGSLVYVPDGVREYLEKDAQMGLVHAKSQESSTISMTITITNVDQETCADFLWDLSSKAIRERFKFDFTKAATTKGQTIRVDEFAALHSMVTSSFKYLIQCAGKDEGKGDADDSSEAANMADPAGGYIIRNLLSHLDQLLVLENEEKGALTPKEKSEIGQNLYTLFCNDTILQRHRDTLQQKHWSSDDMKSIHRWLRDPAVTRKLNGEWREEIPLAINVKRGPLQHLGRMVVTGLLRSRDWEAMNASNWIENFINYEAKNAETEPYNLSDDCDDALEHLSSWCQRFLDLEDEDLDALWYERLAVTVSANYGRSSGIISLYERALGMDGHTWVTHRGLGVELYEIGAYAKGLKHLEKALEGAEQGTPNPPATRSDIMDLHMSAGNCAHLGELIETAANHYFLAINGPEGTSSRLAQLRYIAMMLQLPDKEAARQFLRTLVELVVEQKEDETNGTAKTSGADRAGEKPAMSSIFELLLEDQEHMAFMQRLFSVAKVDEALLQAVIEALKFATDELQTYSYENASPDNSDGGDEGMAKSEVRGTLLYYRGVAAYRFRELDVATLNGLDHVDSALQLWIESRNLLATLGGDNASNMCRVATQALARHYFLQGTLETNSNPQRQIDALRALAEDGKGGSHYSHYPYAVGFLVALCYCRGEMAKCQDVLKNSLTESLQLLADEVDHNDREASVGLYQALTGNRDFENAAVAMALYGLPDIVVRALQLDLRTLDEDANNALNRYRVQDSQADHESQGSQSGKNDNEEKVDSDQKEEEEGEQLDPLPSGVDKQRILDLFSDMAANIAKTVKASVPDSCKQAERILCAIEQFKLLDQELVDKGLLEKRFLGGEDEDATPSLSESDDADVQPDAEKADGVEESVEARDKEADTVETRDEPTEPAPEPATDPKEISPEQIERRVALQLLWDRLVELRDQHVPDVDLTYLDAGYMICDGSTADGAPCQSILNFDHGMYFCQYCPDTIMCPDCFEQLRHTPGCSDDDMKDVKMVCGPHHRWVFFPALGSDVFVGVFAKSLRKPIICEREGDPTVLDIKYSEDSELIDLQEWKEALAKKWEVDISWQNAQ